MYMLSLTLLNVMEERLCQACWTTQKEQVSGHSLKRNFKRRTLNCDAWHSSTLHCQSKLPLTLIYDILIKMQDSIHHLTTFICTNRTLMERLTHSDSHQALGQQGDKSSFRVYLPTHLLLISRHQNMPQLQYKKEQITSLPPQLLTASYLTRAHGNTHPRYPQILDKP